MAKTAAVKKEVKEAKTVEPVEPVDLLMWVGTSNYRTISDFVREAREQGVCKRINKVPNHLALGKSTLFLAHDEGISGDAVIFGYAVIDRVECLVAEGKELDPALAEKGVVAVSMLDVASEDERGCGVRDTEGALYLRGEMKAFMHPVDYNVLVEVTGKRFRGMKKVDGPAILDKESPRKTHPLKRQPHYTGLEKAKRKSKWTPEEVEAAVALVVDRGMTTTQAIKVIARETGRGEQSVNYKFYHGEHSIKRAIEARLGKKSKKDEPEVAHVPIPEEPEVEDDDSIEGVD